MNNKSIILAILLLPALASAIAESPEQAARRYMTDLGFGGQVQGVSCARLDTDNDGYVTCSVAIRGDKPTIQSIQCAAQRKVDETGCESSARGAEGCKPTLVPVVGVSRQ